MHGKDPVDLLLSSLGVCLGCPALATWMPLESALTAPHMKPTPEVRKAVVLAFTFTAICMIAIHAGAISRAFRGRTIALLDLLLEGRRHLANVDRVAVGDAEQVCIDEMRLIATAGEPEFMDADAGVFLEHLATTLEVAGSCRQDRLFDARGIVDRRAHESNFESRHRLGTEWSETRLPLIALATLDRSIRLTRREIASPLLRRARRALWTHPCLMLAAGGHALRSGFPAEMQRQLERNVAITIRLMDQPDVSSPTFQEAFRMIKPVLRMIMPHAPEGDLARRIIQRALVEVSQL